MIHVLSCVGCFSLPNEEEQGPSYKTIQEVADRIKDINQLFQNYSRETRLTDRQSKILEALQYEKESLHQLLINPPYTFVESNQKDARHSFKWKED